MASSYTDLLRLEKMAKGDQNSTWGTTANNQLELLEDAISGQASITHNDAATMTITALDGMADEARCAILRIGGTLTAERALIVPSRTKVYAVYNVSVGNFAVVVRTTGGTGIRVPNGQALLIAIGSDFNAVMVGGLDINSLTAKTTPIDADAIVMMDSAAGNGTRKMLFSSLRAWIATLFVPREDTIAVDVDLNTVITSGMKRLSATHTNMPTGFANGQMFVSKTGDTIAQIIVAPGARRMSWRSSTLTGGTPTWSDAAWTEAAHRPTVSAAAPSGGVDGDMWAQTV